MSDTSAFGFGKFVPGFDFLQNLTKSAGASSASGGAMPGMSNWVAPTLSVEELDKRIQELKAVQFWLEQNGTALKATIQALEVQKMTLTTLQGMNVNMAELAKAFTVRAPETPTPAANTVPAPAPAAEAPPEPPAPAQPEAETGPKAKRRSHAPKPEGSAQASVDPMAWWGSLTQQFQNIASAAMQDVAAEALKTQAAPPAAAATPQPAKTPARKTSRKPSAKTTAAKSPRAGSRKRAG